MASESTVSDKLRSITRIAVALLAAPPEIRAVITEAQNREKAERGVDPFAASGTPRIDRLVQLVAQVANERGHTETVKTWIRNHFGSTDPKPT